MISLRHHIIQQTEETLAAAFEAYVSLVEAIAASANVASPALGDSVAARVKELSQSLRGTTPPSLVVQTGQEVDREITAWGVRAEEHNKKIAAELRELVVAAAEATAAVSERAQLHRDGLRALSVELKGYAELDDLTQIRSLVCKTAIALRVSADRIAEESERSLSALRSQVAVYQQRLEVAEARADTDPVTGLLNRAGATRVMEARIEKQQPFCLVLADLNQFKQLNDRYGHLVGDQVLKCFGEELRANFRSTDKVARWGGDEFLIILANGESELESRLDALRRWAFGNYKVDVGGNRQTVAVTAAIGAAAWKPGLSLEALFAHADAAMYADKNHKPTPNRVA